MTKTNDLQWKFCSVARSLESEIVWIDVQKLDALWKKNLALHIGPNCTGPGNGQKEKYDEFGEWVQEGKDIEMPIVGYDEKTGGVSFTNGRHRFAWLRDHGVKALPVATSSTYTQFFMNSCGTDQRQSQLIAGDMTDEFFILQNISPSAPSRPKAFSVSAPKVTPR